MRTWTRAALGHVCGRCGLPLSDGAPMLVITLRTTTLRRCASCEGPAPPALPDHVRVFDPGPPLRPLRGLLPLVFSRREPGQEG